MDDFIKVIKKGPRVQIRINDILDKYSKLSYNYQSKIGYDTLIQNFILEKIMNLMSITKGDKDIELKMQISRMKYLESKMLYQHN